MEKDWGPQNVTHFLIVDNFVSEVVVFLFNKADCCNFEECLVPQFELYFCSWCDTWWNFVLLGVLIFFHTLHGLCEIPIRNKNLCKILIRTKK
jgi:hypothetical protein